MAKLLEVVARRIPARFGLDPIRDVQVLCPMNRGGLGARALNLELQRLLNPPGEVRVERFGWTFGPGDKVMQVVNNYEKEVFNGDLGLVRAIDAEAGELVVDFEGREVAYDFGELDELVLAYATTVHKAQGSEYPAVVIPVTTQHWPMLQRNLLYTGVTRGKQLVVLVAQPRAVAIAVKGQRERGAGRSSRSGSGRCRQPSSDDPMQQRPAVAQPVSVLDRYGKRAAQRFRRAARHNRAQHDVGEGEQRVMLSRQRLGRYDVQPRGAKMAAREGVHQRRLVDQPGMGGVDQD